MTNQSKISALRPIAKKNAIQEVVFTLLLSDKIQLKPAENFSKLHEGDFKHTFPKFDTITLQGWRFNHNEAVMDNPEVIGFTFESYNPSSGALTKRLRGERQDDVNSPAWVAVNILEYDRWDGESEKAYNWLSKFLEVQDDVEVLGVSLHYIDALFWESATKLPFDGIFNPNSIYLPAKIDNNAEKWSSKIAYEEKSENKKLQNELNVALAINSQNGFQKVSISNPLTYRYNSPISMKQHLNTIIKADFQALHDMNKSILKNILQNEVLSLIGMV